ncbi:PAS domain S-box protein [Planosporangium sp. 12N6]|uniref:PAS domain S-box protein n=1 Tax=Planosporangium spinosum TaxID=3402278 RepID=UPI003CF9EE82
MNETAGSATATERELHRRSAILAAAVRSAERFLSHPETWRAELAEVMADLGAAAEVSRVWISHNFVGADGELYSRQIAEWDADGVSSQQEDPQLQAYPYEAGGFGRWRRVLGANRTLSGHVRDFPEAERRLFVPQGVVSLVGVPVFVGDEWWGIVGFDECHHERAWSEAEVAALRTAATTIGAAVRHERLLNQLRERELQYREIFAASSDGMAIVDLDGVLVEANPAFSAMHGYADGELAGLPATTWTHADHLSAVTHHFGHGAPERAPTVTAQHVRRDGTVFPVEIRGTTFTFRGSPHLLGVVRDVTERVTALELLERRVSALTRVAANLVVDQPLETTLRAAVRTVVEAGSGVAAAVHVMDVDTGDLAMLATYGLPDGYEDALRESWALGVDSPAARALRQQRRQLIRGAPARTLATPTAAPLHRFLPHVPWDTLLALPLDSQGRALGALHVYYLPDVEPEPEETRFLSAVADQVAVAVENARLLRAGRRNAALVERQRLARELHDSVSQALFSMTLHARAAQLAMARQDLPADGPLGRAVEQLRELTQGALAEMRALIFELRPGALAEEGLLSAVTKQAAAMTAREGLPVSVTGPRERLAVPEETEEHLYRIVLEALHNTVKHAGASAASVRIRAAAGAVVVTVSDDGQGFDPGTAYPGHLGLTTMADRARAIGATLRIDSAPGRGTTVEATL